MSEKNISYGTEYLVTKAWSDLSKQHVGKTLVYHYSDELFDVLHYVGTIGNEQVAVPTGHAVLLEHAPVNKHGNSHKERSAEAVKDIRLREGLGQSGGGAAGAKEEKLYPFDLDAALAGKDGFAEAKKKKTTWKDVFPNHRTNHLKKAWEKDPEGTAKLLNKITASAGLPSSEVPNKKDIAELMTLSDEERLKMSSPADKSTKEYPKHYQMWKGMKPFEIHKKLMTEIEYLGFIKGSILKYRLRIFNKEGEEDRDKKKIKTYEEELRKIENE